uniref:Uncharacterized protein n=1 Tax=Oryza brachyantha TaxID=4533 RepID=J3LKK0_ORYBR
GGRRGGHGDRLRREAAAAVAGRRGARAPWAGSPPPASRGLAYVSSLVRFCFSCLCLRWGQSGAMAPRGSLFLQELRSSVADCELGETGEGKNLLRRLMGVIEW